MASKRVLNGRWKFFCQVMLTHGFHKAVRLSTYPKHRCYDALKNDPRLKEYLLSLIGESFKEIKLTLGELIKEMHELSKDSACADKLRYEIKKDLINMLQNADTKAMGQIVTNVPKTLKPAIEDATWGELNEVKTKEERSSEAGNTIEAGKVDSSAA